MNTVSEVEQPVSNSSQAFAPTNAFLWSLKRELWEFRSIYLVPTIVAAVFLVGYLLSTIRLVRRLRAADAMRQHELLQQPFDSVALAIMAATFLVSLFYCLETLHGERRDRSILFWKSLPVSDMTTVLAKATVPLVILPLLTFVLTVVAHCVMAVVTAAVLEGSHIGAAILWQHLALIPMWGMLLYHLVGIHSLWFSPFYGWMLMISAWAKRAPLLWATVPLLALGILERALGLSLIRWFFLNRVSGGPEGVPFTADSMMMGHSTGVLPFWRFMLSPGLWFGLLLTAGFLYAAARIRRSRGPV